MRLAVAAVLVSWLAVCGNALAAPPPNDNFGSAERLTGDSASTGGTNVDATREPGEPGHGQSSVWYRWTPSADGTATVSTCGSGFDTNLVVYTGASVSGLTRVARNDDSFDCRNSTRSRAEFEVTGGTTYQIAVASILEDEGPVGLDAELEPALPPRNDGFGQAVTLTGYEDSARGTNENATHQAGEPRHAGKTGGPSVWFHWTATGNGITVVDTCSSGLDTLLGVYSGRGVGRLKRVAADDNGCGRQSRASFFAKRGTTYRIAVDGRAGDTGKIRVDLVQARTGRYKGRTQLGDSQPLQFTVTPDGRRIKRFTLSQDLSCFRGQRLAGEFRLRRVLLEPMRIRRTPTGGSFSQRAKTRLRGAVSGSLTIRVSGTLRAPDRARGRIRATARFSGGVRCRNFVLGTVNWSIRRR